jgi:hypothetical protein
MFRASTAHHQEVSSVYVANGTAKVTFRRVTKIAYCWKYFPAQLPGNIVGKNERVGNIFSHYCSAIIAAILCGRWSV